MIYELRTYLPAPNRMEDLLNRFQTFTLTLLKKHGLEVMGFWTTGESEDVPNKIVYLLRFPNEGAREIAWNAFKGDPQWKTIKEQSEANGPLVESISEEILTPTAFSPMR
jgi:hypothetical protein